MKIPKFNSIQEEAEWWDKTDTSEWMNDLRPGKPNAIVPADDLCRKCAGKAEPFLGDWTTKDKRLTLHDILLFRCPRCDAVHPAWVVQRTAQKMMEIAFSECLWKKEKSRRLRR